MNLKSFINMVIKLAIDNKPSDYNIIGTEVLTLGFYNYPDSLFRKVCDNKGIDDVRIVEVLDQLDFEKNDLTQTRNTFRITPLLTRISIAASTFSDRDNEQDIADYLFSISSGFKNVCLALDITMDEIISADENYSS